MLTCNCVEWLNWTIITEGTPLLDPIEYCTIRTGPTIPFSWKWAWHLTLAVNFTIGISYNTICTSWWTIICLKTIRNQLKFKMLKTGKITSQWYYTYKMTFLTSRQQLRFNLIIMKSDIKLERLYKVFIKDLTVVISHKFIWNEFRKSFVTFAEQVSYRFI